MKCPECHQDTFTHDAIPWLIEKGRAIVHCECQDCGYEQDVDIPYYTPEEEQE